MVIRFAPDALCRLSDAICTIKFANPY